MPSVTAQKPKGNRTVVPAPNGSLISRGVPVEDLEADLTISALFYGVNRVGKTTLACQFPKPLALVTFEPSPLTGGASSVRKIPGVVTYVVIPSTAETHWPKGKAQPIVGTDGALQLCAELREDNHFKTVVLDGGTSLQDVCLAEIMNLPELPQQMKVARSKDDRSWGVATSDDYMDRSAKAKEVLRKFLNLPKNRIVLCKERDHNPPRDDKGNVRRDKLTRGLTMESFVAADLGQATVGWLNDACDCICRLYIVKETEEQKNNVNGTVITTEIETGRTVRRLLMQLHPNFAAGIRSPDPQRVPEFVEDSTPEGLYKKFMQVVRGEYSAAKK